MPSKATNRVLTDHEEIRKWVEERGGMPARVKDTGDEEAGDPGVLRIDFPGYSGEDTLEPISWDKFFRKFDESGLAIIVQDYTASGEPSNFNKIVSRGTAEAALQKIGPATTTGRKPSAASGRSSASRGKTASKSSGRTSTKTPKSKTAARGRKQTAGAKGTSSSKIITMKKSPGTARNASATRKSNRDQGNSGGRKAA